VERPVAETEYGERQFRSIGLLEVGVAILCYLLLSVAAGVALVARGYDLASEDPAMWLWLIAATAAAPIAGVGVAVALRSRSFAAIGLKRVPGRWLLIGAGIGLLAWAINRGVVLLYVWVTGDASNPQAGLANIAINGSIVQFALLVLLGGLITPFGEEMFFRGVLYTWLRRWGVVLATVISAVVFGVFHGVNVVLPAAIVLGVFNAILYERSGSIWPAVVAHVVNNTLIFAITRIAFEYGLIKNL